MEKGAVLKSIEKMEILLNVEDEDKEKFKNLLRFCPRAMELSIKEKILKVSPKEGEIWTCDFGYNVGSEIDKIRPCVIKSPYDNSNCVMVAPISHTGNIYHTHILLEDEMFEYKDDIIDGTIQVEKSKSLSKARLGKKIGKLTPEAMKKVKLATCKFENITLDIFGELKAKE